MKKYFIILLCLFQYIFCFSQSSEINIQKYYAEKRIDEKVKLYRLLYESYFKKYNYSNELKLIEEIKEYKQKNNFGAIVILKTIYAGLLTNKGVYDKSNELCNELNTIYKDNLDQILTIKLKFIEGINLSKKFKNAEATNLFLDVKNLSTKINDTEDYFNAELSLLTGYLLVRQPDKALNEIDRIIKLFPKEDTEKYLAKIYRYKSTCYLLKALNEDKKYEAQMLEYANKSEELSKKYEDYSSILGCNFSLGVYYAGKSKDKKISNDYLLKGIEAGKMTGNFREVFLLYNYLIQNSLAENDLDQAEYYAKESLNVSKDVDLEEVLFERYYSLAGIYVKKNDDKKTMEMIDSIRSTMVNSFNKRYDAKYLELQTKYETADKEKQIITLDKENTLKELIIEKQIYNLKQQELIEQNRNNEIELLSKDKLLLSKNNELLQNQNQLKSVSILNNEIEIQRQNIEKEKQRILIDQLNTSQKYLKLKNTFIYLSLAVLLAIISLFLFWMRNKQKHKNKIEKQQFEVELLESKLSKHASQMNPHFMFNAMNAVNNYILNNNSEAASNYLTSYSKLMRKVLENSTQNLISLHDELESLKLYIELEQLRFNHKFNYKIHTDSTIDIDDVLIPPLILQPFVENAICHGFLHKEGQCNLNISLKSGQDHVCCIIDDDGVGREYVENLSINSKNSHKSMGLGITISRLKMINKNVPEHEMIKYFDKKDLNGNSLGTKVEIHLAYNS